MQAKTTIVSKTSGFAFFVQTCREEQKKQHPSEPVVFIEFNKKCTEKWKNMNSDDKRLFELIAKDRTKLKMDNSPLKLSIDGKKKKKKRDPNAPKRHQSAFLFYCQKHSYLVRQQNLNLKPAEIVEKLKEMWNNLENKNRFQEQSRKDKDRYEAEMLAYKAKQNSAIDQEPPTKKMKSEN